MVTRVRSNAAAWPATYFSHVSVLHLVVLVEVAVLELPGYPHPTRCHPCPCSGSMDPMVRLGKRAAVPAVSHVSQEPMVVMLDLWPWLRVPDSEVVSVDLCLLKVVYPDSWSVWYLLTRHRQQAVG